MHCDRSVHTTWLIVFRQILSCKFEHVPTPLVFGGVGMLIDEMLNYKVLERTSNEAFQALWVEISFVKKKI